MLHFLKQDGAVAFRRFTMERLLQLEKNCKDRRRGCQGEGGGSTPPLASG